MCKAVPEGRMFRNLTYRLNMTQCVTLIGLLVVCCIPVSASQIKLKVVVTVKDGNNGRPIPRAKVEIQRLRDSVFFETDAVGKATTDVVLEVTRNYKLRITALDYEPREGELSATLLSETVQLKREAVEPPAILLKKNASADVNSGEQTNSTGNNNSRLAADNRNAIDNRRDVSRDDSDHWYQPVLDLYRLLVFYWWVILIIAVISVVLTLWGKGYKVTISRYGSPLPTVRGSVHFINRSLEQINAEIRGIKGTQEQFVNQQATLATGLKEIKTQLGELSARWAAGRGGGHSHQSDQPPEYPSRNSSAPASEYRKLLPPEEVARGAYAALVRNEETSLEPTYLKTEVKSSPMSMLEVEKVHLLEVGHNQGSFVMFLDSAGNGGWVFPNPNVSFRPDALKRVFPELGEMSEVKFQSFKAQINPVPVRQIEPGRWIVE
jgi:hypothetical protein